MNGYISNANSSGNVDLVLHDTGHVTTNATYSSALYALNLGHGNARIVVDGTVETHLEASDGAFAYVSNPDATGEASIVVSDTGRIITRGPSSYGIWAYMGDGQGSTAASVAGRIQTLGDDAYGIHLLADSPTNTAAHSILISGQGSVQTSGSQAHGVRADVAGSAPLSIDFRDDAQVLTSGEQASGVYANTLGTADLSVGAASSIAATGSEAFGARIEAGNDATIVHAGQISASGEYGVGILAASSLSASSVTVNAGAVATGGWQNTANGTGPSTSYPSAGIILGAGTASTLVNAGRIGAGSDRAVADASRGGTPLGNMTIANSGTITGFVELAAGGTNTFNNLSGGLFDIRHFAGTNGNGVRDIKRVSISDFGGPGGSVFNNAGTVRLAPVADAATTDPARYYVPTTGVDSRALEASFYNLNRNGIAQGQLTNLAEFNHSGILDLRGPAIGNMLVITSNASAGGTPGTSVFVANGGHLYLNAVMNDGIPFGGAGNSYSDMLIVDSTSLGSAPTRIHMGYDPSVIGALTPGHGIELVEVRNKAASAAGVFTLGNRVAGGAYEYQLYHNGVGADAADGNWYLRNTLIPPTPEPPGPSPEPRPALPNYRAEVPVAMAVPSLANRFGLTMLGTYHDRGVRITRILSRHRLLQIPSGARIRPKTSAAFQPQSRAPSMPTAQAQAQAVAAWQVGRASLARMVL